MSRTASEWIQYRNELLVARKQLEDALDTMSALMDDVRFSDDHPTVAYAEDKTCRAVEDINAAIGRLTGRWWDAPTSDTPTDERNRSQESNDE